MAWCLPAQGGALVAGVPPVPIQPGQVQPTDLRQRELHQCGYDLHSSQRVGQPDAAPIQASSFAAAWASASGQCPRHRQACQPRPWPRKCSSVRHVPQPHLDVAWHADGPPSAQARPCIVDGRQCAHAQHPARQYTWPVPEQLTCLARLDWQPAMQRRLERGAAAVPEAPGAGLLTCTSADQQDRARARAAHPWSNVSSSRQSARSGMPSEAGCRSATATAAPSGGLPATPAVQVVGG